MFTRHEIRKKETEREREEEKGRERELTKIDTKRKNEIKSLV
jgi:hypothetical protein